MTPHNWELAPGSISPESALALARARSEREDFISPGLAWESGDDTARLMSSAQLPFRPNPLYTAFLIGFIGINPLAQRASFLLVENARDAK
jgi:hypothetical protein